MLKVGLTGGIGSGKSTVAQVFELLGIPIYVADKQAKLLMHNNDELRQSIQSRFGESIYKVGELDRKALSHIVFNDKKALADLNKLVHPIVRCDFSNWAAMQKSPYVIEESAILFETGLYKDFDIVISVLCPMSERIERLLKRDKATIEQIQARINAQVYDTIRQEKSDYILQNGKDDLLLPQVTALDKVLREKV